MTVMTAEDRAAIDAWLGIQRDFVEDCRRRFPDLVDPWLHADDDGQRLWLSEGEHGPRLAEVVVPADLHVPRRTDDGAPGTPSRLIEEP